MDNLDDKKAFVSLRDINKIYPNGVQAVYDFNIDIDKNDFIVLVGPSGCGKSTTLRMIAGLEEITSGYLYIDNVLSNFVSSKDRDISMVFQNYALYPQKTVYDNIAFPLKTRKYRRPMMAKVNLAWSEVLKELNNPNEVIKVIREANDKYLNFGTTYEYVAAKLKISDLAAKILCGLDIKSLEQLEKILPNGKTLYDDIINRARLERQTEMDNLTSKGLSINEKYEVLKDGEVVYHNVTLSKEEIKRKVFKAAKILDLGPYLDRRPRELSGGQMQRVALGRAIVRNSKLFLMDEPLSNLDAKLRVQMRSEIVRIHEQIGATTIYVTHDQTEAMTMATKIVVMSNGWVQQIGTPEDIYNNPKNMFVATFIGSPAMNIFNAMYEDGKIVFDNGYHINLSSDFILRHDKYYNDKINDLRRMLETKDFKKLHALKVIDDVLFDLEDKLDSSCLKKKIDEVVNLANELGCLEVEELLKITDYELVAADINLALKLNAKNKLIEIKNIVKEILDEDGKKALEVVDSRLNEYEKNYKLSCYNGYISNVKKCLEIVSLKENSNVIIDKLNSLNFIDKLTKEDRTWLLEIRQHLLTFDKISSSDVGKLHNAQVFNREDVKNNETLYYQKPKKKKKIVSNVNMSAVDIFFDNSLYEVACSLLEKYQAALVNKHPIKIGIRPENIHLYDNYEGNKTDCFTVKSEIVELLGSELLIHSNWASSNIIAKVSTNVLIKPHTDVNLTFDKDKILVFDDYSKDTI